MVTLVEKKTIAKYLGLSTDDKPMMVSDAVGMPNGSQFLEMDTGKKFYYDGDQSQWSEMTSSDDSGGGSGGGGGGGLSTAKMTVNWNARAGDLIVPVAFDDEEPYSSGCVANIGTGTYVYDVILNEGIAYLVAGVMNVPSGVNSVQIVGSGDITVLEGGAEADITGDCSISFLVT